jgi:hypothetical protein
VSPTGEPLPWYTFPCIDFLQLRDFSGRSVLEFGGGQSSVWWGRCAASMLTFEGDEAWFARIRSGMPGNVDLRLVRGSTPDLRVAEIRASIRAMGERRFDVIVIDGLDRRLLVPIACELLAEGGVIICDNAEGYGFHEALKGRGLSRVDFYGHAPGLSCRIPRQSCSGEVRGSSTATARRSGLSTVGDGRRSIDSRACAASRD